MAPTYPLSLQQEGIVEHTPSNTSGLAMRMPRNIGPAQVRDAVLRVVTRFGTLRTSISHRHQMVSASAEIPFEQDEIEISEDAPPNEVLQLVKAGMAPFHVDSGPLVRARTIDAGNRGLFLALSIHHVLCDEWSTAVLAEAINTELSSASPRDQPAEELYGPFAAAQRKKVASFEVNPVAIPRWAAYAEAWREKVDHLEANSTWSHVPYEGALRLTADLEMPALALVRQECLRRGSTFSSYCLTALHRALREVTLDPTPIIDCVTSGRVNPRTRAARRTLHRPYPDHLGAASRRLRSGHS